MKMILLLHLEDDEARVSELLKEHGVVAWSRLPLEGHGPGLAGWSGGGTSPYRSSMAFTVVPSARAQALLDAVEVLDGLADPRHPVHALQLDIERAVDSRPPVEGGDNPNTETTR